MKHWAGIFACCMILLAAGCGLFAAERGHASDAVFNDAQRARIERVVNEGPGPMQDQPVGEQENSGLDMVLRILGIFLGGIALNLTPCVYPLIPVTISYFCGKSSCDTDGRSSDVVFHALLYIAGLAFMNSMLGVLAALSGQLIGAVLQNPITIIVVAAILVFFASSMFGYWEFRLPGAVTGVAAKNYAGYFGSLFIGLTVGLVAAPCIGPFVVGLLVWVAGTGNPWFGFLVFFTLSLGMGLPLFVLALLSGRIQRLPRSGEWMLWVRKVMGWVLVGMAAFFVRSLLSDTGGTALLAVTALAAGAHLGWIDSSTAGFRAFGWIKKAVGILSVGVAAALALSLVMQGGGVRWQPYSEKTLAEATMSGKPVIVDFSADWCVPCRRMEKYTFHDSSVVEAAEKYFVMIKVDLTHSADKETENVVRRYSVRGVPTVLFLKPGGEERKDLRVLEFRDKDRFLAAMEELRKSDAGPDGQVGGTP